MRRPLLLSLAIAVALFAALWSSIAFVIFRTNLTTHSGWISTLVQVSGGLAVAVLSLILFPSIVLGLSSLFLEGVIRAVEARYYSSLPRSQRVSWTVSMTSSLKLTTILLVANLICLPLYFFPGLGAILFPLLNGYFLAREYFEMVALRRLPPSEAAQRFRNRKFSLWIAGAMFSFLALVPGLDLTCARPGIRDVYASFSCVKQRSISSLKKRGSSRRPSSASRNRYPPSHCKRSGYYISCRSWSILDSRMHELRRDRQ